MAAYVNAIEAGPPTNAPYLTGDTLTDVNDVVWQCVEGGSPGLWAPVSLVRQVATGSYLPTSADAAFFIAARPMRVKAIKVRVAVVGTDVGAVTLQIRKAASGVAPSAGTVLHTGNANLKTTANTDQDLALSATAADLELAVGDALCMDFTGVLTAAVGHVSVTLEPR